MNNSVNNSVNKKEGEMNMNNNELMNKLNNKKEGVKNMNNKLNNNGVEVELTIGGVEKMETAMKEVLGQEMVTEIEKAMRQVNIDAHNAKRAKAVKVAAEKKAAADRRSKAGSAIKEARKIAKANIADLNTLLAKEVVVRTQEIKEESTAPSVDRVAMVKKSAALYAMASMRFNGEDNSVISADEFMAMGDEAKVDYLKALDATQKYVSVRNAEFARRAGADNTIVDAMVSEIHEIKEKLNMNTFGRKKLKRWSKEIQTVNTRQVELSVSKKSGEYGQIKDSVNVMSSQDSALLRACKCDTLKFADASYATKAYGTEEVITLKVSSLVEEDDRIKYLNVVFDRIKDTENKRSGLFLIISKNGFAKLSWTRPSAIAGTKNYLPEGAKCYRYAFLDISASGYRSCSLTLAAIESIVNVDGVIKTTDCDRREELLNVATDDALRLTYKTVENGEEVWTTMTKLQAFKASNRLANGNAPSKVSFDVKNAVVFNNIAELATYQVDDTLMSAHKANVKGVDCKDTKDGTGFAATESFVAFLNEQGEPIRKSVVEGTCFQTRGIGTLKSSTQFISRKKVAYLTQYLIEQGAKINYVIFNGKKTSWDALTIDEQQQLIANIDVCADRNAIKLDGHKDNVSIVMLKMAYESETKLSQILNIAMAHADLDGTLDLLRRRFTMLVSDAFRQVGIKFELDKDGTIVDTVFDPSAIKKLSNSSQLMEHILNSDPEKTIAAFPYAVRHIMANNIESLANRLTALDIPCDAKYTVVQADPGVLFGVRILGLDEFFCGDKDNKAEATAAIRQPMSGLAAISVWKRVDIETITKRILATDLDVKAKEWLVDYYTNLYGFNVVPASHYHMEKHDGMDWDIDAMMFYYDEEVVAICSKSEEFGTKIVRTEDDYILTELEQMIERWVEGNGQLERVESAVKSVSATTNAKRANNKMKGVAISRKAVKKVDPNQVTVSFNSVSELVREVFSNPIAPVGVITSGFYNNALILLCLLNNIDTEAICTELAKYYGCNATEGTKYTSPIERKINELGYVELTISKDVVCEAIIRFSESYGSVEDCLAFITDCCILNRYPAETSIDAAKNNYKMLDYVNHRGIIRCLGMDKHMKFVTVSANSQALTSTLGGHLKDDQSLLCDYNAKLYAEAATALGLEVDGQFLGLPMIAKVIKTKEAVAIEDPIAQLKLALAESVNQLIVLAEAEVADFVCSEEAAEIRAEIRAIYEEGEATYSKSMDDTARIIKNVNSAYANLTLTLKEEDVQDFARNDDYEELTKKEAVTSVGVATIRNYATMAFNNMAASDIGILIAMHYVDQLEESLAKAQGINTINPGLTKVMENEFIAGLAELGFEDVDMVGEKLESAIDITNSKYVNPAKLEGEFICVEDGHAVVDVDGIQYDVRTSSKKSNIEGFVEIVDGHAYVLTERVMNVDETQTAMTLSAFDAYEEESINDICNEVVKYTFEATFNGATNVLTAELADGAVIALCRLSLSDFSKKYIQAASDLGLLTPDTVSCYTNDAVDAEGEAYERVSVVIHDIMNHDVDIRTKVVENNKSKASKARRTTKRFKAPVMNNTEVQSVDNNTESVDNNTEFVSGEVVSLGAAPSFKRA